MALSNSFLSSLSESDVAALRPHLMPVYLNQKTILYGAGAVVDAVIFLPAPSCRWSWVYQRAI